MTQHPPTYYLVAAVLLRVIGFRDLPWGDAVLVLRFLDVVLVAALPVIAGAAVRRLTRSPRAAVVGAVALLAVPQVAVVGSAVTNDAPVMLGSALATLVVVRIMTGDDRRRMLVALVALLVALAWTKGMGLPVIRVALLAVLVSGWRRDRRRAVLRAVSVAVSVAVLGGWWWARNVLVFGHLQPDGFVGRPDKAFPPGGPDPTEFVAVSWDTITRTFWGSSGFNAAHAVTPLLSDVGSVLGLTVVVVYAFRSGPLRSPAVVLAALPVLLFVLQTATSWSSFLRTTGVNGTQGRYYFPALVALVVLSALAWRRLPGSEAGRRRLSTGIAVTALVVAVYGVWFQWRVSWQDGAFVVTAGGLRSYAADGLAPAAVVVVLAAALVVAAVAAGVLVRRALVPVTARPDEAHR